MNDLNNFLRDAFPCHANFQPDVLPPETELFRGWRGEFYRRWHVDRRWVAHTRDGGMHSNWPAVQLTRAWWALETDDDMEFADYTFCHKRFFTPLETILTVHVRGDRVSCNPANLRRAFNLGLKDALQREP